MGNKDPRVDAYIARSAEFARPVLAHLRRVVHEGCPGARETIKWGFPHFMYEGMLCSMAAFKQHCAFGFWRRAKEVIKGRSDDQRAMGQFGRITRVADLPSKAELTRLVKRAAELNELGVKSPRAPKAKKREALVVPDEFAVALRKNHKAGASFDGFSYSHRKEYVQWITEARRPETRARRIATAVEWLAQGRSRNWKYE